MKFYSTAKNEERKFLVKFLGALFFVYIVLFEFILPANKILPRPTLLAESFFLIWKDYNLLFSLIVTVSVVYISMAAGYFIVYLCRNLICRIYFSYPMAISASKIFKYFPAFFYAVMFDFWFEGSYGAEFLFAVLAFISLMSVSFINSIKNVKKEYLILAEGLNLRDSDVYSKIIWNYCRPELYKAIQKYNFYFWVIILLFEYIADIEGLGRAYNQMLQYKDLSGLVITAVIIAVVIYISSKLINLLSLKLIHWKNE